MTKIKTIKVHNVKAIADQELNLNGATAIIYAGNNKGKSTLLTALKERLLKHKADHIVRQGESEGLYEMHFTTGETITWELSTKTKAGEKLTLISPDGNKTSVIANIIKWFGPAEFDIDKFLNDTPAAQRKSLEKLLGLDFSDLDIKYAKAFEDRKFANRDVERLEVLYKGKSVDPNLSAEITPLDNLQLELLSVESHNLRYKTLQEKEEALIRKRTELEEALRLVNIELDTLDNQLSDSSLLPKDSAYIENLKGRIDQIKELNERITANNETAKGLRELQQYKDIAHEKAMVVQDILTAKDKMIQNANMPEGFGFGEEGILYEGFPLTKEQLSTSRIYIAALKLASLNVGNVRMLHFDASMLDNQSLEEVLAWAKGENMQLGIEMVDRDGRDIRYEIVEDEV